MNDKDNPPWDINAIPTNQIDIEHIFIEQKNIFNIKMNEENNSIDNKIPQTLIKQNYNIETDNTNKDLNNMQQTNIESINLALKYRPKTFAELIGQDSVAKTLCLALDSKKIANAYLFSGLRGSGKTSSARILARCLQCQNGITSSPCGNCPNCKAALKGSHIDIIELDGASNRKIDDIRDIIEQTKYKPTMGRFKVFIIDEVHMLTKEAFNSLLKTLEEPPNYVKFILATTDPLKIPATILSRTQHFRFKKIPTNALKNHLIHILQKEGVSTDSNSLDMIIRNGHGSVRDTLTLLDQAIVFCQNELTTQKLANMLGSLDPKEFDKLFQALLRKNMQECLQFIHSLDGYEIEMILDELSLYIKNKMLEEIPEIPPILGMRYANIINDSRVMLQLDCDSDFCLLLTILKMLEAQKIKEIESAIKQLETMQNNELENIQQKQVDTIQTNEINKNTLQNNQINNIETFSHEENTQQDLIESKKNLNKIDKDINAINQNNTTKTNNKDIRYILTKNNEKFLHLIQKLYERDYIIGDLFENKIEFNKIENQILYVTFYTTQEEIELLRQGYNGIMQIIREVFGNQTKMQVDKKPPKDLESLLYKNIEISNENNSNIKQDNEHKNYIKENIEVNKDDLEIMNFINQNKDILKTMKDKLGVKDMKIVPLDFN